MEKLQQHQWSRAVKSRLSYKNATILVCLFNITTVLLLLHGFFYSPSPKSPISNKARPAAAHPSPTLSSLYRRPATPSTAALRPPLQVLRAVALLQVTSAAYSTSRQTPPLRHDSAAPLQPGSASPLPADSVRPRCSVPAPARLRRPASGRLCPPPLLSAHALYRHIKESEDIRRALIPHDLIKRVREIGEGVYVETEQMLQKDVKQTAAVDLISRLNNFRSYSDAGSNKALEEWRKRKMERARQRSLGKDGTASSQPY